ncbi:hypothetical protein, partial [Alistipes shahii]|uniref:hypothetical protein n=1 Tax=Alistipes shahii TaxID=328814 RepID=UPI0032BF5CF0
KVLNGHIILTDTSITTILAPEMTYTPRFFSMKKGELSSSSPFLSPPPASINNIMQAAPLNWKEQYIFEKKHDTEKHVRY